MVGRWLRHAGAAALIVSAGITGACRDSVKSARTVAVVPQPPETGDRHLPAFSRLAAERVRQEIAARGFAAIASGGTGRPDSCRVVNHAEAAVAADLRIFVWIQQVDLPLPEFPSERPRAWGGLVIRNRAGRDLTTSRHVLASATPAPSNAFYRLGRPDEAAAGRAAEDFAAWLIASPGRLSEALGGGDAKNPDRN